MQGNYGSDQPVILYYAVYAFVQLAMVVLPILIVVLVVRWIYSLVVVATSSDGGQRWYEEQGRRRRERYVLGMAVACFASGIALGVSGYDAGPIVVRGFGVEIPNAGFGVIMIGAMCLIVWMLLRAPREAVKPYPAERFTPAQPMDGSVEHNPPVPAPLVPAAFLTHVTFAKAGVITVVLFLIPGIGPLVAIPAGIFLFIRAANNPRSDP